MFAPHTILLALASLTATAAAQNGKVVSTLLSHTQRTTTHHPLTPHAVLFLAARPRQHLPSRTGRQHRGRERADRILLAPEQRVQAAQLCAGLQHRRLQYQLQ